MVVYYQDIIDKIVAGEEHYYTMEALIKLGEWKVNDTRSKYLKDKERKQ